MAFEADDLARSALVELIPRHRYRLAGRDDQRFAGFAPDCVRIAFQHLGGHPSLLLFCGPGHNPHDAARQAASWAEANWRPSAIQRRVTPGVVAVHVAPGPNLAEAGAVESAAVPAVVWTVDADTGAVDARERVAGGPSPGPIRRAARHLAKGGQPSPIGFLDLAERRVMSPRRRRASGFAVPSIVGLALIFIGLRFGMMVLVGIFNLVHRALGNP